MTNDSLKHLLPGLAIGMLLGAAAPAHAQYRPISATRAAAVGPPAEQYHVEIGANFWRPEPNFTVASDAPDATGTSIGARTNLLMEKKAIWDLRLSVKVAAKHKFRFAYHSTTYAGTGLEGAITFNGQQYPTKANIASEFQWRTYRLGYEYDLVSTASGFFGVTLDAKVARGQLRLTGTDFGNQFATAQAPIPAIGAIGRVYLSPTLSVTAEYKYFDLPSNLIEGTDAHFSEIDVYTIYNLSKNIGAQVGYRKADAGVSVDGVRANAKLSGFYYGAVVRF